MKDVYHLMKRILNRLFISIYSIKKLDFYLFLLSCIIIIAIKFFQFPILTYHAEMFGENATNFFFHAYNNHLLETLLITDYGYLPLTQRFISLILVQGLHIVTFYPYVSQFFAILGIAIFSSLINFNIFKSLTSSSAIRFILGLAIGLNSDFELNVFMNFIYYGAIFLFLGILINKEKLSQLKLFLLCLATIIVVLSKGQFIVFVPIYFLLLLFYYKKKQIQSLIFYLCALGAGFVQLITLSLNASGNDTAPKLFLLPYYVIKSIYYLVLTYKHVFFGYVTKEGTTIIAIGILAILFTIAIRTLIKKKDTYTLAIFAAANFIAICSLFLTIILYSATNPNIQKITAAISQSSSLVSTTKTVTTDVYENAQKTQNIFEVKHHANARGLFISNVLIFLAGLLVLLHLFPKKRDKLLFLLIIVFTSGAFGQIRAEEMYVNKTESYSHWGNYAPLLKNDQYCIPVNNYPFLIKKNCDYLLSRKTENLFNSPPKTDKILLSTISPVTEYWEIQSAILVNKPNQFLNTPSLVLYAYNKENEIIGKAHQLVTTNNEFIYFLFDKPVTSAETLIWKNQNQQTLTITPNLILFGRDTQGNPATIEY